MTWHHVLSRLPAAVAAQPVVALALAVVIVVVVVGIYRDIIATRRR